jgi:hypothetical protein
MKLRLLRIILQQQHQQLSPRPNENMPVSINIKQTTCFKNRNG